jgi:hypothetical protein
VLEHLGGNVSGRHCIDRDADRVLVELVGASEVEARVAGERSGQPDSVGGDSERYDAELVPS